MQMTESSPSPKIVVLISGNGSNLQALIEQTQNDTIDAEIVLVISNKASALGLERAHKAGIPTLILDQVELDVRGQFERNLMQELDNIQPALIVLAGFMRVLSGHFCGKYAGRILNIHPSLLPKLKGLNTHQRAIQANMLDHGASVHFVTEELDGGPIILQAIVKVMTGETAPSLASRVLAQEHIIYPIAIKWFCDGRLTLQGSQALLDKKVLPKQGIPYRQ